MPKKLLKTYIPVVVLLIIVFAVPIFSVTAQTLGDSINKNLTDVNRPIGLTNPSGGLPATAGQIIKSALTFVGIIFLALVLYGGFLWMTAGGKSEQVEKASSFIKNSVIGLVIISVSYAIVYTVFDILIQVK